MIGRSETFIKWLLYALATFVLFAVQGVLRDLRLFGVLPFLYPVMAATLAMYEGAFAGTVYCLVLGVVCDSLLPGPIPCFYTLVFPLAGLCAGLMARNWLPAGFACCLAASAVAFLLTDAFHCLLLAFRGEFCTAALTTAAAETCLTLCFSPAAVLLFRPIYRKCHLDD